MLSTPSRRSLALVAGAAALAGGLTACDKPTPAVTVVNHGVSVRSQAVKYFRKGSLATFTRKPTVIYVKPGEQLGIDVDQGIAANPWGIVVEVNGQNSTGIVNNGTYDSIQVPQLGTQNTATLAVFKLDKNRATLGEWEFVLAAR